MGILSENENNQAILIVLIILPSQAFLGIFSILKPVYLSEDQKSLMFEIKKADRTLNF